jgi:hypothetical protein
MGFLVLPDSKRNHYATVSRARTDFSASLWRSIVARAWLPASVAPTAMPIEFTHAGRNEQNGILLSGRWRIIWRRE